MPGPGTCPIGHSTRAHPVNASGLKVLFDFVFLLAMSAWVGGTLFAALVAGPLVGGLLSQELLRPLARPVVTRFFQWVALSAALALPARVAVPLAFPELRGPRVGVEALVVIASALAMLYTGNVLVPRALDAREAGEAGSRTFRRLYRRAVGLTVAVLVAGMLLLAAYVIRPAPTSAGIVEPGPVERARLEEEALRRKGAVAPLPEPAP